MNNFFSIIIPIYNEFSKLNELISGLKFYYNLGHEIVIIDDGSNDNSRKLLLKFDFINLICSNKNLGKGTAIINGLRRAKNEKIIIFDGDLELNPDQIIKLMSTKEKCVFGVRQNLYTYSNIWSIGNRFFTWLFNFINNSNIKDALCCAKSFSKSDLILDNLKSTAFDIDIEIASILIKKYKNIKTVDLQYIRRNTIDGKKLRLKDSILILKRLLLSY